MALKVLLLKRQRDIKAQALEALRAKDAEFTAREAELETAIGEVESDEQRTAVEQMVTEFEAERDQHRADESALETEIAGLDDQIREIEAAQETGGEQGGSQGGEPRNEETRSEETMEIRGNAVAMTMRDRLAGIVTRDDVKTYLGEIRAAISEKRAVGNVGLTIPEVMLGLLRENLIEYSKLYRHVTVRPVGGTARMLIMGAVPEAVWTDCCANLNELTIVFNDLEVDCFKVGGYFAVCNANLEDSDIDLAGELLTALGQANGLALDKAILYGRNGQTAMRMPQGIVSRLVQTEEPGGYPATARPWADLHTSNVISITAANSTGIKLFQSLVTAFGAAKGKYSRGTIVHVMNEATYTKLMAEAMAVNAAGAIVTGVGGTMPVIGGDIEVLSFVPDNVIISGYFDLYVLAERAGTRFASSEHVRFLADQTVFKGTARYDGAPAIAEAFVAIGIGGATPTSAMQFAAAGEEDGK